MSQELEEIQVPGVGAGDKATVNTPIPAHDNMVAASRLHRTLWGGTRSMRNAEQRYLPKEPKESLKAYAIRLQRAVLYNMFKRTVQSLRARPFREGIQTIDEVPDEVKAWFDNVDLMGRQLLVFARDVLEDGMVPGLTHLLADAPEFERDGSGKVLKLNLEEEQRMNRRPWLVNIPMESVIGWRSKKFGGQRVLTEVRIRERQSLDDGRWGQKERDVVKVLLPGKYEIWAAGGRDGKDWTKASIEKEGPRSIEDIPLHTFYSNQTGYLEARSPFTDLGYINERHWQASSDRAHILHVANFPFLFLAGDLRGQEDDDDLQQYVEDSEDEEVGAGAETDVALGPNVMLQGKMGTALGYVEAQGNTISALDDYLSALEEQGAMLGLEALLPRKGQPKITATQGIMDFTEEMSDLEAMTHGEVAALSDATRSMAALAGVKGVPEGALFTVSQNMGLSVKDIGDLEALKFARQNGDISREAFLHELKRRRTLDVDYDHEDDLEKIENESPMVGQGGADQAFGNPLELLTGGKGGEE